jgi:membrane protein CcdC involved in cytochrome C biogenesis
MPVLYALILLSFIYALTLDEILISVALAAAAIPVGMRASENPEFFFRDQTLYFKRSIMLTVMWIWGFLARTFLEIFYSTGNNFVDFVVTALLTLTLGLIIGERYVIYNKGKVIQQTGKINQSDEFVPKGDRSN